jgi:hypothetical protein
MKCGGCREAGKGNDGEDVRVLWGVDNEEGI